MLNWVGHVCGVFMSTYAIGDVQGCFDALRRLLTLIAFNPNEDKLWFVGDVVNRGPKSLDMLRFLVQHPRCAHMVLGNHDLHLLACYFGMQTLSKSDTLSDVLTAPDVDELMAYLRAQPLMSVEKGYVLVHAGIAPLWTVQQAQTLADEVAGLLKGEEVVRLLANMYGNEPAKWDDDLSGWARYRCIINYFTRMRCCDAKGRLDLDATGDVASAPPGYYPWYQVPGRVNIKQHIVFGHWAALLGHTGCEHAIALDTGCVWGGALTAFKLETGERFSCA